MKRKLEDSEYNIIKKIKTEHFLESRKRKLYIPHHDRAKKICTEKDHYIKKLERCLIELFKKYEESQYLLELERSKSYVNTNNTLYVC